MDRIKRYSNHGVRYCSPKCADHEQPVRQGLAYTPSDMYDLVQRGIPVNNLNMQEAYFDGTKDASFHIGAERKRGVDVAELWENYQVLRDKARKAAYASRKKD